MSVKQGRGLLAFFGAVLLIAASSRLALATAPTLMTYQGRLKQTGLPVTGNRSVDVYLCPDPSGPLGDCFSTGAQGVQVANGLFRTTFTAPSSVNWATGSWYLEISVDGASFSPRERLAAAPYAIYASSAATLVPNPGQTTISIASSVAVAATGFSVGGTTFVVTGGRVGIGTASPGSQLEVSGTLTLSGVGHVRLTGAPAPTTGIGCGGADSSVVGSDSAGRITIGTDAPGSECTLNFGTAWSPNYPVCHFNNDSRLQTLRVSAVTGASATLSASATLVSGDVIGYICLSY